MKTWDVPGGATLPTPASAAASLRETNCTHETEHILGWRMVTNRHKQKGTIAKDSQRQYLVSWQPTLLEEWEMQAYQACGYTVRSVQRTTFAELADKEDLSHFYDQLTCEVCNSPDRGDDLVVCDTCQRLYHWQCASLAAKPTLAENWSCNHCYRVQHLRSCRRDAPANRAPELCIVHWAPTWEPADQLRRMSSYKSGKSAN